jgi:tetratricopeptide (TPR) repeat protein
MAMANLTVLLKREGLLDESLTLFEELERGFRRDKDKENLAFVLRAQSDIYKNKGELDKALAKTEASLKLVGRTGNKQMVPVSQITAESACLYQLANISRLKGNKKKALRLFQEAEKLDRRTNDAAGVAADLRQQGLCLVALKQPQRALAAFSESLRIARGINDQSMIANNLLEIGTMLAPIPESRASSAEMLIEALAISRELGDPLQICDCLQTLGGLHELQDEYSEALEKYEQVLALDLQYGVSRNLEVDRENIERVKRQIAGMSTEEGLRRKGG